MNLREAFETLVIPCKPVRKGTASAEKSAMKWLECLVPDVAKIPVEKFTSKELALFKAAWASTELTPQTFNKYLRHLRSILRELFEMEVIQKLPRCRELPELDPDVRIADTEELERLYRHASVAEWPVDQPVAPVDYWRGLIVVAVSTGLRRGDLLNIKPPDLNFVEMTITYRSGKTGKRRTIPIAQFARDHLEPLMNKCNPDKPIFYSTASRRQFYREWERIQDAAEISPPIDIHDLRRTCGSHIYKTAGLSAASQMLAHSSVAVTQKHYVSTSAVSEILRPAVDSIPNPAMGLKTPKTPNGETQ